MRTYMLLLIGLVLACTGCANRSFVRESLAKLPSGDEIAFEYEVVSAGFGNCSPRGNSGLVWRRISPNKYLLSIEGQGEVYASDHGKVLTERGDVKAWHEKYGQSVGTANVRVTPDGDRAWLVHEGRTIASFNYRESVAYFGDEQPDWASPTTPN
jgi:hypothetical protein